MTRASRLRDRRSHRRRNVRRTARRVALLTVAALVVAIGVAWAATSTAKWYACVNDAGQAEPSRAGISQPVCAHAYDRVVTHDVGVPDSTSTTLPSSTTAPTTTTTPPTTTTQPTTTTRPGPPAGNVKPPPGGYFSVLAPGAALPSEASCAAAVHRSTWEPRPDNAAANARQVTNTLSRSGWSFNSAWVNTWLPRINGNWHGTTDEMFQFYACKWGWSDNLLRAEAISESNWHQSQVGDAGTSYGILQIRYLYHPRIACKSCAGSSWPNTELSTAWNLDQFGAEVRACYEGMEPYLGNTRGDTWGCIARWFSGAWAPGGHTSYADGVRQHLADKVWLGWSG